MENLRAIRTVIWLTAAVGAGGMLLAFMTVPLLTWRLVVALIIVALALAYAVRTALVLASEIERRERQDDRPE